MQIINDVIEKGMYVINQRFKINSLKRNRNYKNII